MTWSDVKRKIALPIVLCMGAFLFRDVISLFEGLSGVLHYGIILSVIIVVIAGLALWQDKKKAGYFLIVSAAIIYIIAKGSVDLSTSFKYFLETLCSFPLVLAGFAIFQYRPAFLTDQKIQEMDLMPLLGLSLLLSSLWDTYYNFGLGINFDSIILIVLPFISILGIIAGIGLIFRNKFCGYYIYFVMFIAAFILELLVLTAPAFLASTRTVSGDGIIYLFRTFLLNNFTGMEGYSIWESFGTLIFPATILILLLTVLRGSFTRKSTVN